MPTTITQRDRDLAPIVHRVLRDAMLLEENLTYTEFCRKVENLSIGHGDYRIDPRGAGRLLDYYAHTRDPEEPDMAHLVVRAGSGEVGRGYWKRGEQFVEPVPDVTWIDRYTGDRKTLRDTLPETVLLTWADGSLFIHAERCNHHFTEGDGNTIVSREAISHTAVVGPAQHAAQEPEALIFICAWSGGPAEARS